MPKCRYAKSDMTPCVLKDGAICFAMDSSDRPICVGCERSAETLGVPVPADWDEQVADYKKKHLPGNIATTMSTPLEALVREWYEAQKAIDRMTVEQRQKDRAPLDRLIAAHNALLKYARETW